MSTARVAAAIAAAIVANDPEGIGQPRRDSAQPTVVPEVLRGGFGGAVVLEEAARPRERLQGHAQVEPQVDRLLLRLTSLGKMFNRHQRILVPDHGFLERRAGDSFVSSLPEVRGGRLPPLRPESMVTETVGVLAEPVGVEALDGRHDLAVERAGAGPGAGSRRPPRG